MEITLVPAPIDEKNITSDWIEEIFDDCNCTFSGNTVTGFINGAACTCTYQKNHIYWEIHKFFGGNDRIYNELVKRLKERDVVPYIVVKYDDSLSKELMLKQSFFFVEK